jgi:acyl-CoA synthetase (NDP forming)
VSDSVCTVVPEHEVKELLARHGLRSPARVTAESADRLFHAAAGLRAPLVVKAFGPTIVHKTELGAVVLDVDHSTVVSVAETMSARLAAAGIEPAGYLVEEQAPDEGVELIIGVVRDPEFGPIVALGLGGTLAEVLDRVAVRLCPLTPDAAVELLRSSPVAAVLDGVRGGPPVDRDALRDALVAIAGADGLAASLGDELRELECNPVLAGPSGVLALDARLVLGPASTDSTGDQPAADFTRLVRPRGVVIAGASATRGAGFGNRALAAYREMGWSDGLYALHPTAASVDGVPAVASIGDIAEPIDYLLVAVPATACADLVRATAGQVPFVHVISGGFGETSAEGAMVEQELLVAAREVGARVIGPNCLGMYSPAGRHAFQLDAPEERGRVGVISQSGGLGGDIVKAGSVRGIAFSQVITVGNSIDVNAGELAEWMVRDPHTGLIGMYLEGTRGAGRLVSALRSARGRIPAVALLGGQSRQGADAVMSHTGSMVGEPRIWEAVSHETGLTVVSTLEHMLAALTYLDRWLDVSSTSSVANGVLAIGMGGGASVLATDACDRAGLSVTPTVEAVRAHFRSLGYGAGTSLANPVEIPFGPAAATDSLRSVLDPLLAVQPYADVVVHINVQAYYSYGTGGIDPLLAQIEHLAGAYWPTTRVAVAWRNLGCAPALDRERLLATAIECRLPTFDGLDEAAVAIAAMQRFDVHRTQRDDTFLTV